MGGEQRIVSFSPYRLVVYTSLLFWLIRHSSYVRKRSGMATVMKMSAGQLGEKYLTTGVVEHIDLERYCRFADDPNTWAIYYATIAVSGRKAVE